MEEEKKLYPLRLSPLESRYGWGSESFLLADLGYRDSLVREGWLAANALSEVMETFLDRLVGEDVFDWFGQQFPFQVKSVRVRGRMPLRVHPDDDTARPRYDALGKEKFWYVTRAGRDACVLAGVERPCDATTFYLACLENRVESLLRHIPVQTGSWLHIPAGVPHAALGDLDLVEVSESSGLDFWLCSWGEELSSEEFDPSMSLTDALDFVRLTPGGVGVGKPGQCALTLPQFSVRLLHLGGPQPVRLTPDSSCRGYVCVQGRCRVRALMADGLDGAWSLGPEEVLLVPAECASYVLEPEGGPAEVLEILVEHRTERDPYING